MRKIIGVCANLPDLPNYERQAQFLRMWFEMYFQKEGTFSTISVDTPLSDGITTLYYEEKRGRKVHPFQDKDVTMILVFHHKILGDKEPDDIMNVVKEFHDNHIRVRVGDMDVDITSKEGESVFESLLKFSKYFNGVLKKVIKANIESQPCRGFQPAFGFKLIGGRLKKQLTVNDKSWNVVQQIYFRRFILEESLNSISSKLNFQGYRTQAKKTFFSTMQVHRVLKNPDIAQFFEIARKEGKL